VAGRFEQLVGGGGAIYRQGRELLFFNA
jgi:hypothetical protein